MRRDESFTAIVTNSQTRGSTALVRSIAVVDEIMLFISGGATTSALTVQIRFADALLLHFQTPELHLPLDAPYTRRLRAPLRYG